MSISVNVADAGGGNVVVSWGSDVESGFHRVGLFVNVSPGGEVSGGALSGSATIFVGYYTSVTAQAGVSYYKNSTGAFDHDEAAYSSASTGPPPYYPPPAGPAIPTLSGSSDTPSGTMSLSWSNVGATFYDVYRDGVNITRVYNSTSYVDTPGGSSHSYYVYAANSGAGGTTFATSQSNTVALSFIPPAGVNVRTAQGTWARKPLAKPRYIRRSDSTWKLT